MSLRTPSSITHPRARLRRRTPPRLRPGVTAPCWLRCDSPWLAVSPLAPARTAELWRSVYTPILEKLQLTAPAAGDK